MKHDWPGERAIQRLPPEIQEVIRDRVALGCQTIEEPRKNPRRSAIAARMRGELITAAIRSGKGIRCVFCRCSLTRDTVTLEHLTPLSRGGTWERTNLALACLTCNREKGARTAEEWRAIMKRL